MRHFAKRCLADASGDPEVLVECGRLPMSKAWRDLTSPAPDAIEEGAMALPITGFFLDGARACAERRSGTWGRGPSMVIEPTRALIAVDLIGAIPRCGWLKAKLGGGPRPATRCLRLSGLGGQGRSWILAPMPKNDRRRFERMR